MSFDQAQWTLRAALDVRGTVMISEIRLPYMVVSPIRGGILQPPTPWTGSGTKRPLAVTKMTGLTS